MAASFPFTSPSSGTTDSSSSSTTPTFTNGNGAGGWIGNRRDDQGSLVAKLGTNSMIANMVATPNSLAALSMTNNMACDKCRQTPDSLSELHTLPCLHTLCRTCFQTQGNSYVPTSPQHLNCPICAAGGSMVGDDPVSANSASFFRNYPTFSTLSPSNTRQEQLFPISTSSGNVHPPRNAPSLSSSYLFNEQLNVDTSLLIGSLLDSVSLHDDLSQLQPKNLPREQSLAVGGGKFAVAPPASSPMQVSSTTNAPLGFRPFGGANTTSANALPSPLLHLTPSRFPHQQISSLAVGGHRAVGAPLLSSQQQLMAAKLGATSTSSISSISSVSNCSMCSDGAEAICRCDDCAEYLCSKCVQAHLRVRLTKDHRIVPMVNQNNQQNQIAPTHSPASAIPPNPWQTSGGQSNLLAARSSSCQPAVLSKQQPSPVVSVQQKATPAVGFCAQHHAEPKSFFCETCTEPLCRQCGFNGISHPFPAHKIVSIVPQGASNANEGETKRNDSPSLVQLFNDSRQCVRVLDEAVRGVDHMTERVESRMHSVANEIRATVHQHIGALEERKRELLERVDAVRAAKLGALNLQKEDLRRYLASSRNNLDQAESLLKACQQKPQRQDEENESLVRMRQLLQEHLQLLKSARPCLQPQEDDQLSFSSPDANILKTVRLLGNIVTGAYAPNCTLLGDSIRRAIKDKLICYTVQARDHVGEPLTTGGDQVNAFALVKSGNGDGSAMELVPSPVSVFDKKNGTYVCRFEPAREGEHQIHIFVRGSPIRGSPFTLIVRRGRDYSTIGATPLFSFGGEGTGDGQLCRPWGICCDKQGRIIVADRSNSRIQVFDQEGKFLYKFGSPGCKNGQFDRPAGVTVNSKSQLVVVDKDNHRVQVFTLDGQFLFKFGEKGRGNGQFNYPWDVAVSSNDDSIAVSDTRNHRVQLFDAHSNFLNKFGFESSLFYKQFDSPRGLVFAPDGRLFCTDFNNHRLAVIDIVHNQMEFFGREGEYDGAFKRPQGLDMDLEGHLIIADSRNNRIQVFTPQLTFLCSFGIDGYPPRGRSVMDRPCDVCVCEGKIFVVDFGNNKVHVY